MSESKVTRRLAVALLAFLGVVLAACGGPAGRVVDDVAVTSLSGGPGSARSVDCSAAGRAEHVTFEESSQGVQGDYRVYLPPCYDEDPATTYPVVYLLHGAGEDDTYWQQVGVEDAADAAIARGDIPPMILVVPDGGPGFGSGRGGASFDSFLVDELVPRIDASYRTIASRDGRAVGGISLGGGRALAIAAQSPELFAAAGGHSPALADSSDIAAGLTDGGVNVWLDVGEGDSLRGGAIELADQMSALGGHVVLHVPEGGHDRSYWRSHLGEYVAFYAGVFASQT
ncbi:MAG: alpha/beta hydrolase-fold protein [Ornithinimicrobium sp.]